MAPQSPSLVDICQVVDPYRPLTLVNLRHRVTGTVFTVRTLDLALDLPVAIDWLSQDTGSPLPKTGEDFVNSYLMMASQPDMQTFMVLAGAAPMMLLDVRVEQHLFFNQTGVWNNYLLSLTPPASLAFPETTHALQTAVLALMEAQYLDQLFLELDSYQAYLEKFICQVGFSPFRPHFIERRKWKYFLFERYGGTELIRRQFDAC